MFCIGLARHSRIARVHPQPHGFDDGHGHRADDHGTSALCLRAPVSRSALAGSFQCDGYAVGRVAGPPVESKRFRSTRH